MLLTQSSCASDIINVWTSAETGWKAKFPRARFRRPRIFSVRAVNNDILRCMLESNPQLLERLGNYHSSDEKRIKHLTFIRIETELNSAEKKLSDHVWEPLISLSIRRDIVQAHRGIWKVDSQWKYTKKKVYFKTPTITAIFGEPELYAWNALPIIQRLSGPRYQHDMTQSKIINANTCCRRRTECSLSSKSGQDHPE